MRPTVTLPLALLLAAPLPATGAQATDSAARSVASALPLRPALELRRAGARYAPVVRTCYEREGLLQDPALRGRLEVGFTVSPSGRVSEIAVDTLGVRGMGMRDVARCVVDAAAAWHLSAGAFAPEAVVLAYDLVPPLPVASNDSSLARAETDSLPSSSPDSLPRSGPPPR